jgi:hypothetical protein
MLCLLNILLTSSQIDRNYFLEFLIFFQFYLLMSLLELSFIIYFNLFFIKVFSLVILIMSLTG